MDVFEEYADTDWGSIVENGLPAKKTTESQSIFDPEYAAEEWFQQFFGQGYPDLETEKPADEAGFSFRS